MTESTEANYKKMTETPMLFLIAGLSVPTIITMLVTNIYNLVDTAFVGKLGTSQSGAVGIVFGFMSILQAAGFMFGQGAGSNMARCLGARRKDEADVYASFGFFGSFFLAMTVSVVCLFFLEPLVFILGSTQTIAPYAKSYIIYLLFSAPFCSSSFTLNNLLRYEGKAKLAMIGMMSGAVLNIGGDALFMFAFKMGIAGAGLSTALSQVVSFCILLAMYFSNRTECKISFSKLSLNIPVLLNILATGFPSLLRQALNSITTMLLNGRAAVLGDAAVAAMSIVSRISFFIFSIAIGIGQGFQPVSSFNYGARKYSRVKKGFLVTLVLSVITTGVISVFVLIFTDSLIQIFRDDMNVVEIGRRALRLQCATVFFLPCSMITEMLFQSTGQKLGASVLSSFRGGIIFIPALLLLSYFRGLAGIQESQPLSYVVTGLAAFGFMAVYFYKLPKKDGFVSS